MSKKQKYKKKKSDALVGRVNTFIILFTKIKPSKFGISMIRPLKFTNFKTLSFVVLFLDPN
jgi:hypothetical protein